NNASKIINNAREQAASIKKEAEVTGEAIKNDKILQAKERFIELKSEHEKVILKRDRKISDTEKRIRDKESILSKEISKNKKLNAGLEKTIEEHTERLNVLEIKENEIKNMHNKQVQELELISGMSAEEAKTQLVNSLKENAKADAMVFIQNEIEEAKLTAQKEARKIVVNTIQRIGTEEAVENCVSVFNLESDD